MVHFTWIFTGIICFFIFTSTFKFIKDQYEEKKNEDKAWEMIRSMQEVV
jgi:hypothetical protein